MSDGGNEGGKGVIKREGATKQVRGRLTIEGGGCSTLRRELSERRVEQRTTVRRCDGREGWLRSKDLKTRTITPGELRGCVGVRLEGQWRIVRGFAEERKRRVFGGAGFGQPAK